MKTMRLNERPCEFDQGKRRSLQRLSAGLLVGTTLSAGLPRGLLAAAAQQGRRVILIELVGANDGLNTVVPFRNDTYHALRPTLGLRGKDLIGLDDEVALNASLKSLMTLWERGELAIVQGLGYPAPNRSHFKSIALWETGSDGRRSHSQGWLTHDIEHRLGRAVRDAHGISLSGEEGLFRSDGGRWLSITSLEQLLRSRSPEPVELTTDNDVLAMVARRQRELDDLLTRLRQRLSSAPEAPAMPEQALGRQFAQAIRMIRAGVDTPVYRVQIGSFDTHENQRGRHNALLQQLADAVAALARVLEQDGEWNNTLVMSYSEFGRRAGENDSGGTDHGTAAPHLVAGGALRGGLLGVPPDLSVLQDGDPAFTMDYRALYERVLADWFDVHDNRYAAYRDERLDALFRA